MARSKVVNDNRILETPSVEQMVTKPKDDKEEQSEEKMSEKDMITPEPEDSGDKKTTNIKETEIRSIIEIAKISNNQVAIINENYIKKKIYTEIYERWIQPIGEQLNRINQREDQRNIKSNQYDIENLKHLTANYEEFVQ